MREAVREGAQIGEIDPSQVIDYRVVLMAVSDSVKNGVAGV